MRNEYNITGYIGVKKKFGYTACEDKLCCLFNRNNLKYIRKSKHHKYSYNELLFAIDMINKHGFEYYANYASTKYAFTPLPGNFKKILIRHNLINALSIKI